MKIKFSHGLIMLSLAVMSCHLFAFGQNGHRITGKIAEQYLTEQAKRAISEIIGNESLAEASTYVDEMRSDPAKFWQKTASPYHYITIPNEKTYLEVGAPKQGDAIWALKKYSLVLKNKKSSKSEKALAVKFIVHIIGDLHQPLHVGNGTDRGGNDVKLKYFGKESNLHRVWDSEMIASRDLSYSEWSEWLTRTISDSDVKQWSITDPMVWIEESEQIRKTIYPKSDSIKYRYLYNNLPIVKRRLKQAGVRMAAYLNELFEKNN